MGTEFGIPRTYTRVSNSRVRLTASGVPDSSDLLASTGLVDALSLLEDHGGLQFDARFNTESGEFLDLSIFGELTDVPVDISDVTEVPLPAGLPLLAVAVGALAAAAGKRRRARL